VKLNLIDNNLVEGFLALMLSCSSCLTDWELCSDAVGSCAGLLIHRTEVGNVHLHESHGQASHSLLCSSPDHVTCKSGGPVYMGIVP